MLFVSRVLCRPSRMALTTVGGFGSLAPAGSATSARQATDPTHSERVMSAAVVGDGRALATRFPTAAAALGACGVARPSGLREVFAVTAAFRGNAAGDAGLVTGSANSSNGWR